MYVRVGTCVHASTWHVCEHAHQWARILYPFLQVGKLSYKAVKQLAEVTAGLGKTAKRCQMPEPYAGHQTRFCSVWATVESTWFWAQKLTHPMCPSLCISCSSVFAQELYTLFTRAAEVYCLPTGSTAGAGAGLHSPAPPTTPFAALHVVGTHGGVEIQTEKDWLESDLGCMWPIDHPNHGDLLGHPQPFNLPQLLPPQEKSCTGQM